MKSTRLLVKRLIENDVQFTDNINEAMYILADGSLVSGEYDMGMRGQDHRQIFVDVDYGDYYQSPNTARTHWDRLHSEYKVVRLVPENKVALIRVRQQLTPEQIEILSQTDYEIERY